MTWTVAGINFAHFHMGDLLGLVEENPDAEIVGICDENQEESTLGLWDTAEHFGLNDEQVYTDHHVCLQETDPDIVLLCPIPAEHADWVEKVAEYDVAVILEKPLATSLDHADRILEAMADRTFVINWPLAWYASHRTAKRLIDEGRIGDVIEVHYYDGNRGGGRFTKVEYGSGGEMHFAGGEADTDPADETWWHQPDRGGGSLNDYLGYGVNLGTWFRDGQLPTEVTTSTYTPDWSAGDTHSITIAKYDTGLSKYETRWGTFTDPWVNQPQPKCGFVLVGSAGTIASYDYEDTVRVQDGDQPEGYQVSVDPLKPPLEDVLQYTIHCLETGSAVEFPPLQPAHCRETQRIIDTARLSAERGETVELIGHNDPISN